jgi:hypothetical protein
MPPFIVGKLQQELPSGYVLTNVLEPVNDERLVVGYRIEERNFFDTINRTYVWRCEILGGKPDLDEMPGASEADYDTGGMG